MSSEIAGSCCLREDYLRAFDEPQLQIADCEEAARLNDVCRARGIAGRR